MPDRCVHRDRYTIRRGGRTIGLFRICGKPAVTLITYRGKNGACTWGYCAKHEVQGDVSAALMADSIERRSL